MNFLLRFMENCHTFCHTRDLYFIAYRCIWLYVGTFATNEKSPETRGFDDVFVSCWISLVVVVQIGAGGGGENRTRVQKLSIPASTCVANSLSSYRQPCKLAMPVAGQLLSFAPAVTTPAGTSSYDMSLPSIAGPGLDANRLQRLTGN